MLDIVAILYMLGFFTLILVFWIRRNKFSDGHHTIILKRKNETSWAKVTICEFWKGLNSLHKVLFAIDNQLFAFYISKSISKDGCKFTIEVEPLTDKDELKRD